MERYAAAKVEKKLEINVGLIFNNFEDRNEPIGKKDESLVCWIIKSCTK